MKNYITIGNGYDGVRLANNNFEVRLTPHIWEMLAELVTLKGINTPRRTELMNNINTEMGKL